VVLEQHYLGCLAHASYFVADDRSHVAAVVDPQRDVGRYLEMAEQTGCQIRHVFLTHLHADFLAGHLELRDRTGALIHLGARAQAEYEFEAEPDGAIIGLGPSVRIEVLETPGHSPESISLLVYDLDAYQEKPYAVLSGDTLFVGDVGRPDLRAALGWSAEELAAQLYDSLQEKLLTLPDATLLYPAHGPGTLCGRNLGSETFSTIGEQRLLNYALQPTSREEFIRLVTAEQPDAPAYFTYDAMLNAQEHATLTQSLERELRPLSLAEVLELQEAGTQILDTRPAEQFEAAHLRGSLGIGLDGRYATWVGTLVESDRQLAIIADPGREQESVVRLGRIGFDHVAGYLEGGMAALAERPDLIEQIERLAPSALSARLDLFESERPLLLDVRTESELGGKLIDGALNIPLGQLADRAVELPHDRQLVTYCSSGYRSAIAASLLQADGFERVADLVGGTTAWEGRDLSSQ
jgi:glyoxylase-like metal-dependent hydrolase (beta-lactamase superfamily II)/rhodanese-related sulfurtransferase